MQQTQSSNSILENTTIQQQFYTFYLRLKVQQTRRISIKHYTTNRGLACTLRFHNHNFLDFRFTIQYSLIPLWMCHFILLGVKRITAYQIHPTLCIIGKIPIIVTFFFWIHINRMVFTLGNMECHIIVHQREIQGEILRAQSLFPIFTVSISCGFHIVIFDGWGRFDKYQVSQSIRTC